MRRVPRSCSSIVRSSTRSTATCAPRAISRSVPRSSASAIPAIPSHRLTSRPSSSPAFSPAAPSPGLVTAQLRGAFRHAASLVAYRAVRSQERERHRELTELTRVGVALSTERDLLSLLTLILSQARRITTSDAGSLYLVEHDDEGRPEALRFKLSQNESLTSVPLSEFTVPIDHTSLAGYTAATREPLVIPDVYLLPEDVSYRLNRTFDEKFGYRTKSMLVIPMTTHRDEIVGVLQLINRKKLMGTRLTTPETRRSRGAVRTTIAPSSWSPRWRRRRPCRSRTRLLYENIERLFEGFVTAAVTAIESRDPATFGHSERVAKMTVSLARCVDRNGTGRYRGTRFTRRRSSASSATPACCTTSARSACANRCW